MKNLRFGVVGVGGRGSGWARDLNHIEGVDLVGICDIRKEQAELVAKKEKISYWTTNYDELLDQKLDAIVIATPHYLHAPFTIKAAEREINVFCEKPMAVTLKECDDMIRAVRQNAVKLAIGFQYRFNKTYRMMKAAIEKGHLGKVFQVNMFTRWWRPELYYETSAHHWRGRWATEGGGALINQTVHNMDIFQWLGGPIQDIQASAHIYAHEFQETEDNVGAVVNFKNGAIGLIQAGVAYAHYQVDELSVVGTEGAMIFRDHKLIDNRSAKYKKEPLLPETNDESKNSMMDETAVEDEKENKNETGEIKKGKPNPLIGNFIQAIRDDDPSIISVDGEEGKKTIEIIRGIYMSIMNNGKVSFPVADNGTFPVLGKYYKSDFF